METDVLIVGGGLSGLSLADHLTRSGAEFLLVESRDHLGGRILTKEISGGSFDLGPAWFWPGQTRMADLVRRFSLPVFEQFASGDLIHQDQSGAIQRGRGYASMQGSLRLGGGMGALISALADTVDSRRFFLGTALHSLTYKDNLITAKLEGFDKLDQVFAKCVLLAVPPRVVAESIAFQPPLTGPQRDALAQIPTWMAGQAKILAVYEEPHWRNAGLSGDATSQHGPMVEIHDASPAKGGPYALFGFVGVPPKARAKHKEELMHFALDQLSTMFGPAMAGPLNLTIKDWAMVPEIATSKDHVPVRNHPHYGLPPDLRNLWDGTLHLTSTEVGHHYGGFLEGALEAAEETARTLTTYKPRLA